MATFDPFDNEFGNRARGLRRTPSAQSWNRLEQRLDRRRRRRGTRILGIRPWMIAALILIVAGVSIIANTATDRNNPLARQAEFIEELSTPYTPEEVFEPKEYVREHNNAGKVNQDPDFRDVMVAEKYRVNG